jgi:AhpD family alkylhydroperoxidase
MFALAPIRRLIFGLSPEETSFRQRGFPPVEPAVQTHLETAGQSFIEGYNAALAAPRADLLTARLNPIDATIRGFAFEGAAMALALLDLLTPWNRARIQSFIECPAGDAHSYMLHIGVGWAIARIPWARRNFQRAMRRYHPLYRWLTVDGYGFNEGFFYTRRYVQEQVVPSRLTAVWSAFRESMLVGSVPREIKEAIAVSISQINRCPFCVDAHVVMLHAAMAHGAVWALVNGRADRLSERMRAVTSWARATVVAADGR